MDCLVQILPKASNAEGFTFLSGARWGRHFGKIQCRMYFTGIQRQGLYSQLIYHFRGFHGRGIQL